MNHSVLIVEDNPTLRRLLEYRLGKLYNVRSAEHGERALVMIEEELPDLILSDIMMPRMDGFALLAALRQEERTRTIPFIFLTAKTDDPSRARGLGIGVDDYITKPFDIEYVVKRIEKILERTAVYQNQLNAKIGRDFSDRLMPKTMPRAPGYRAMFFHQPREDGGGDMFDWAEIPRREDESPAYLFTVGDIMGKGLQAKFYAFSFLSYIRSTVHAILGQTSSPAAVLRHVNEMLLRDHMLEETFASLLVLKWEPALNRITYANAGHCRPILVTKQRAGLVEHSDLVLGLAPNADFVDRAFTLPPGSALCCYTDGLIEQTTPEGGMVGEIGLARIAGQALATDQPIHSLLSGLLRNSAEPRFQDDILVFWLQRQAEAETQRASVPPLRPEGEPAFHS
ncbi:hypothetical protein BH23BAC4_BH23BAC4_08880 [soil metagenome]